MSEMRVLNQKSLNLSIGTVEILTEITLLEDDDGVQTLIIREKIRKGGEDLGGVSQRTIRL